MNLARLLFFVALFFVQLSSAHGPAEDPTEKLERLNRLVGNLNRAVDEFVISQNEEIRHYQFDNGQERVNVRRGALASALYKVLKAELELAAHSVECPHCKHAHEVEKEAMGFLAKRIDSIVDLYQERQRLGFEALRMAGYRQGRNGWPMAVTVVVTWPLYTAVTEVVESFFVGPLHMVCNLFQVFYAAAVFKAGDVLAKAADLARVDHEGYTYFDKMKSLYTVRMLMRTYLRQAIFSAGGRETVILQKESLEHLKEKEPALWSRLHQSPLWPDFISESPVVTRRPLGVNEDRFRADIESLFSDDLSKVQKAFRADEVVVFYRTLSAVLSDKAMQVSLQGRLGKKQFFQIQSRLGRLSRSVDQLEVYLKTAVALQAPVTLQRKELLVEMLKALWQIYGRVNIAIEAPAENSRWAEVTDELRRREVDLLDLQRRIESLKRNVREVVSAKPVVRGWPVSMVLTCGQMHLKY